MFCQFNSQEGNNPTQGPETATYQTDDESEFVRPPPGPRNEQVEAHLKQLPALPARFGAGGGERRMPLHRLARRCACPGCPDPPPLEATETDVTLQNATRSLWLGKLEETRS